MPDSSKAKARRRAAAEKETERLNELKNWGTVIVEEALAKDRTSIPENYRKIAESEDMYTRTRVSGYYNAQDKTYYFSFKDDDTERVFGPLKKRNIQTIIDVLKDVSGSGPHHYIE